MLGRGPRATPGWLAALNVAMLVFASAPASAIAASPPTIAADAASVTVDEYTQAQLTGTWSDPDGDNVDVSATVGTVTTHGGGTWSWSYYTQDGPADLVVTFTATDSTNATDSVDVDLHVLNVPPSAVTWGPAFAPVSATASRFYRWQVGDVNGDNPQPTVGCGSGTVVDSGQTNTDGVFFIRCRFTMAGSSMVGVQATDKDGAHTDGRIPVIATSAIRSMSDGRLRIGGAQDGDYIGGALGVVDLDADGRADVAIGSSGPTYDFPVGDPGLIHVVRGRPDAVTLNLGTLPGGAGWTIAGPPDVRFGSALAAAGDVNHDGVGDLLIGALGAAWVVFGHAGFAGLDVRTMSATEGFKLSNRSNFEPDPQDLAGLGDVNGDGFADVGIGSPSAGSGGELAVVLGSASPTDVDVSNVPAGKGFVVTANGDKTGWAAAGADVNGDGRSDVIVASPGGPYSSVLVVYGSATPIDVDEATMTSSQGFVLHTSASGSVSTVAAGDMDRDGYADVAVAFSAPGQVAVTVVRGGSTNASVAYLESASGSRFQTIDLGGQGGPGAATRLAMGDLTDDGYAELAIGTDFAVSNGDNAGSAYVIRGGATLPNLDLTQLNARWSRIDGDVAYSLAGCGLGTGDVDGDGAGDLVVGAEGATNWQDVSSGVVSVFGGSLSGDVKAPSATGPAASLAKTGLVHPTVPVKVTWSGSDSGTGIWRFELQQQTDDGAWLPLPPVRTATTRTINLATGHDYQFRVRAIDGSGNVSSWRYGRQFALKGFSESSSRITYHRVWKPSSSSDWWGGAAKYSTVAGASATLTFTGREIVWVSGTGSDRGNARIYVNGVLVHSVDLRLLPARATIVFRMAWSTTARRTIRIVVQETPGPNRVDLDGLVVMD